MCTIEFLQAAVTVRIAHIECHSPQFLCLHKLYRRIYESCEEWFDKLAERSMAVGENLPTMRYVQTPPVSKDRIQDVTAALMSVKAAIEKDYPDADKVTKALLDEALCDVDKYLWQLKASTP